MKGLIKKSVFLFLTIIVIFVTTASANAESNSDINSIDYSEYTADENFDFENNNYTLGDYVESIISGDNPQPELRLYAANTSFSMIGGAYGMEVIGDDPITSLVPKELFKIPYISKVHIGEEYGFFIKTKSIDEIIYSNVYLFDIVNDFQKSAPSHYIFTIKPLFQREYVYFDKSISSIKTQRITNDLSQGDGTYEVCLSTNIIASDVVTPLPYCLNTTNYYFAENKEYYLTNVKNVINIANEQHLNYGQEGYNAYDDKGMFITQQDIEYQAKVNNINDDKWCDTTKVVLSTGIGHTITALLEEFSGVSTVNEIIESASKENEVIESAVNITDAISNEAVGVGTKLTYTPKYTTANAQIMHYFYLAKSSISSLGIDETNENCNDGSYLFFDNNDYVSFDYQLSYTPVENDLGYEIPWETRIGRGLSLTFNSFNGESSVQESDICNFTISDENEREFKQISEDNIVNILPNGENFFIFTPNKSGHYSFTTNNSLYIPNFEIIDYDLDVDKIAINQSDIDVNVYLQKGLTYKFRLSYPEVDQSDSFNMKCEFKPQEIDLSDNYIELTYDEYFYKFTPGNNAYYKATIDNTTLPIYDQDLNIQSTDANGYSILNSGRVYYVILNKDDYSTSNLNITIVDKMEISFYNNRSDANPVNRMNYSTISQGDLYIPSQKGYNFVGWETYDGTVVDCIDDFIEPNLSLYAKWEVLEYTINYFGINGEIIKSCVYTVETGFNLDDAPTIVDYIILSWLDGNGNIISTSSNVIGNINCYPKYVKEKSVISFDLMSNITDGIEAVLSNNGGSVEINYSQQATLPIPSISGFEFEGWYYGYMQASDENGLMISGIKFSDDTVLEAKWIRTAYHFYVEVLSDNGTYSFSMEQRNTLTQDNFSLPVEEVVNNIFALSYLEYLLNDLLEKALMNDDLTIDTYKPGYHFEYYTSKLNDANSKVYLIDLNDALDGFVLYPYYESKQYIVKLCDNAVCIQTLDVDYQTYLQKQISNETCFTLDSSRVGYLYQGFYTADGICVFDKDNKLTQEGLTFLQRLPDNNIITLSREYTPIEYYIKYNSNGGNGTMPNSLHVYDVSKSLSRNLFSKTGYTFIGWNTSPDGTGASFDDLESVINLSNTSNATSVLYCQWEANTYTVKYISNGGSGNSYSRIYYYDGAFTINNNQYLRTGHTFIGWSRSSNGAVEYLPGESVTNLTNQKSEIVTLYAIWEANSYSITYKNLLTSMYTPNLSSYTYGQDVSLPLTIDYSDGYTVNEFPWFEGWYEDAKFTKPIIQISATRTGNINLYAKYDYKQNIYFGARGWTITDDGTEKILIADNEDLSKAIFEINGAFSNATVELTLIMREKNDGYQEIKLYNALSNGTESIIFENSAYDYGGNGKNSNFGTVKFVGNSISMSTLGNSEGLYLELGAHGSFGDDWEVSYISVTLTYTSN